MVLLVTIVHSEMVEVGLVGRILVIILVKLWGITRPVGGILKYVRINPTWLVYLVNSKIISVILS